MHNPGLFLCRHRYRPSFLRNRIEAERMQIEIDLRRLLQLSHWV